MVGGAQIERVKSAASRFRAFFGELGGAFVEREDVLAQSAFALLSREHTLITGPPGTAKSRIAWSLLGRIVDEKSGEPSLYSRQFTESTVQTDLIGPIDFKTLMETGRTEHFTEQGMLGAVHGFLDEVFDGRDMLLRSTLNVLYERELKQGTKTTRGLIECAILTTNRYLAEVLDGSREALLAFIDRIAYVGFVPRGFGDVRNLNRLLERELARGKSPPLSALLTIQDVDALQNLVETVMLPPELCELLHEFLASFEAEIAAAVRADPTFTPTRYLSTRTLLRLGRTLRAACVWDYAMNGQSRPLIVERKDFRALRLGLVLCGPPLDHLTALLKKESDPRERRQLEIVRTEREIFERCLAKLRDVKPAPPPPPVEDALLAASSGESLRTSSALELLETTKRLASAAERGAGESVARERLSRAVSELGQRAIQAGFAAAGPDELSPLQAALELEELADTIDQKNPAEPAIARWLRGQALALVGHGVRFAPLASGGNLEQLLTSSFELKKVERAAQRRIERLQGLLEIQTRLIAKGVDGQVPGIADEHWQNALARLGDDLAALFDSTLLRTVDQALENVPKGELSGLLTAVEGPLAALRELRPSLDELGANTDALLARVFGERLKPLVQASCERFDGEDRGVVADQVATLLDTLEGFDLARTIPAPELLTWMTYALLRAEPNWSSAADRYSRDLSGYRALRAENQRVSLAYTLSGLCLRLCSSTGREPCADLLAPVRALLGALPRELTDQIIAADVARIAAPLALLEGWWSELAGVDAQSSTALLERVASSRFLHVTRDEGALVRFALDARLLAQVLPDADVTGLEKRLAELDRATDKVVREHLKVTKEQSWQATLGRANGK